MSLEELEEVEVRQRLDRWIEESQDVLARIIPGMLDQHGREDARDPLLREAGELRRELSSLRTEIRSLRAELGELSRAAIAVADRVAQALPPAAPPPARPTAGPAIGIAVGLAAGVAGLILLAAGLMARLPGPAPAPPPIPAPAVSGPPTVEPPPGASAQERPAPAAPVGREPASAPAPKRTAAATARAPLPSARDEIRNFRAESVSGLEIQVTVDYSYAGDHGASDIFVHAVALETDDWASRVPGTSFPEASIGVGTGSVTIAIKKLPDTGGAASTRVKVCMVSIRDRSAFACQTFPYVKSWDS